MASDIPHLLKQYGLRRSHVYLLELVPIIEVMWADGHNQKGELNALESILKKHLAKLREYAGGVTVVPQDEVDEFMQALVYQRPDPSLLKELRGLLQERLESTSINTKKSILENCFDIAAACAADYPYGFDERIEASEKEMLWEIFQTLQFDHDSM